MSDFKIKLYSITLDCKNPDELAKFYADLLKWEVVFSNGEFACVGAPGMAQGAYPGITIQMNPDYEPPVWPQVGDEQQQMAHMDFAVDDLEKSVEHAIKCGAALSKDQFSDSWRVLFDPAGHPFCLCQMKSVMDSPDFGLL